MMRVRRTEHLRWIVRASLVIALAGSTPVSAQDALERAKTSYVQAAYEEALRLLAPLDTSEAQQYKALCFLALGRTQEAAGTIDALIGANPLFAPSEEELPPRFLGLVLDAKRKLLPGAARQAFTKGREHFNAKAHQDALKQFEFVLRLTADPVIKDSADAEDLRTLAQGFVDLAQASTPPRAPAAPRAEPSAPLPPAIPPEVVPATAIRQDVPPAPPNLPRTAVRVGLVRVTIGADGRVVSAALDRSVHPRYDDLLLKAAHEWIYKPATLAGRPVVSEKQITIRLE